MRILSVLTATSIALFAFAATANAQGTGQTPDQGMSSDHMAKPMKKPMMHKSMMHKKTMHKSMMHKRMTKKQRMMMMKKQKKMMSHQNM